MHCSNAFALLKPVCDEVVKNPSKKCLQDLKETFGKIPFKTLLQLQDYVLYPLELSLQRPNISSETRRYIIDCIHQLVHCTEVNSLKKFLHLYSLLFIQLFDKDSSSMVASVAEELKLSVIQCVTKITQKCPDDIVGEIYNKNNVPRISQGIFICVHIMQNEKLRSLRIAAMEFIMAITQVDNQERCIEVWKPSVADMIMFIVPGILTGLHKVAIGDEKQGHLVTKTALRAWSRILVLVLEDITISRTQAKIHFSAKVTERVHAEVKSNDTSPDNKKENQSLLKTIQNQKRSIEWAECVAENISKMSKSLRLLQNHSHWKVRLELAEACHSILDKCQQHLKATSVDFVEILLNLSDDEADLVASASQAAIDSLTRRLEEEDGMSLFEILEENFYGLVTKLPRIIHIESDSEKLATLRLLKQYLILIGAGRLPQLLQNTSHLERTVLALLQAAELQSSNMTLLSDCSLRDLELNQDAVFHTPWKQFKHFDDKSIIQKLEEVLMLLGKNGDLEILCNHLLDLLGTDSEHRNEIVFALNEIILGGLHSEENIHVMKNVLDTYLSPQLWKVPLTVSVTKNKKKTNSTSEVMSISQVRSNLQLACLLAEGVGYVASTLQTQFSRFLMHCLYPIVERAGSPHESLTAAGLKAAAAMAKSVHQGNDITSLLAANMDYFMVQVSLRLRNLRTDPGVLSVLGIAMRHSTQEMLPYLQNAVTDVLLQCCDTYQMQHTSSFLHVFYIFFLCIKKWFPNRNNKKEICSKETINVSSVTNEFVEYIQNSQRCKVQFKDSEFNEDYTEQTENMSEPNVSDYVEEEPSEKQQVPSHIKMTVSVVQRCLHLLPRKDKQCRLQALEALIEGLEVLADYEDELLPMVHKVWSPLIGRLQDTSDPLLLNRSFLLLTTLARLAQDFIRARTLKQVWAGLCSFLSEAAEKSQNKGSGSAFQYSQLFKLQLCLLQGLGGLATHLQLQEKEVYQMLVAAAPYLSARQPKPLQESCVRLFQIVAEYDGDAVWLEIVKIEKQAKPLFKDNREYKKNVELVMEWLTSSERITVQNT